MNWTSLHPKIDYHFNEEEFRTICFRLNIDYDNLGGRGKSANALELLSLVKHGGHEENLCVLRALCGEANFFQWTHQ